MHTCMNVSQVSVLYKSLEIHSKLIEGLRDIDLNKSQTSHQLISVEKLIFNK